MKGLFNVLDNNKLVIFFDILTQNMLKEIDNVFDMNSLALIFSEGHLNLKMVVLTSFSLRDVLTQKCSYSNAHNYLNNYTR